MLIFVVILYGKSSLHNYTKLENMHYLIMYFVNLVRINFLVESFNTFGRRQPVTGVENFETLKYLPPSKPVKIVWRWYSQQFPQIVRYDYDWLWSRRVPILKNVICKTRWWYAPTSKVISTMIRFTSTFLIPKKTFIFMNGNLKGSSDITD